MAGHAQLKFVMTECSKTQIRLAGLTLCIVIAWHMTIVVMKYFLFYLFSLLNYNILSYDSVIKHLRIKVTPIKAAHSYKSFIFLAPFVFKTICDNPWLYLCHIYCKTSKNYCNYCKIGHIEFLQSNASKRCRRNGKQCRPDQTAPRAVWSGSTLFAQTCLSEN